MTALTFTVLGRPLTWQHTGGVGGAKGIRLDARGKAALAYTRLVQGHALRARQQAKVAGLTWPDVTSHEPRFRVDVDAWWPDHKEGDADRLLSLVFDALEGAVYKKDRQVKASSVELHAPDKANPRLVVSVRVMATGAGRGR